MKKFVSYLIVIVFATWTTYTSAQSRKYPFEVRISGQGKQAIIFIPGFACSGEVWDETKSQYEKDYVCYTLTMAGFAGIDPQPDPSFQNWERAIASYIRENKINKPIIIGHSMGGGLALAIAADYPDLVSRIIVVDALPCLAALQDPAFKTKEDNDCSAMIGQMKAATNEQFYAMQKSNMPGMLADTTRLEMVVAWSVRSDRTTMGTVFCDFLNTDLRQKISTVQCPALILLESYFSNMKPAIEEQYKNLKTANLQYATKGLHFIMYDDPAWYNKQLSDFIRQ